MVTMLDTGLKTSTTSGNYDRARLLANTELERAKSLAYATVKSNFPAGTGNPNVTSPAQASASYPGLSYTITKEYLAQPAEGIAAQSFVTSSTDQGLIRLTVRVTWGSGNMYSASGVVVQ